MEVRPQHVDATETAKTQPRRRRHAIAVVLLVAAAFVVIRSRTGLVFDDTPGLGSILYDWTDGGSGESFGKLTEIVRDSFTVRQPLNYRPLSHIEVRLGVLVYLGRLLNPTIWLCLTGLVHGAAACSVLCVARRFVQNDFWALFAAFLFLFSVPYVTAAWVVVAGIQGIVSLVICGGLLLYWRFAEGRAYSRWAYGGLCVAMLCGPWFREFIGILPLLVMCEELRRHRKPTWLTAIAGLCLLHAVFPMTLIKVFFAHDLPLCSVFQTGSLGATLDHANGGGLSGWMRHEFETLRWIAGWNFVVLFPPLLLCLAVLGFLIESVSDLFKAGLRVTTGPGRDTSERRLVSFFARLRRINAAAVWPVACAGLLIALKWYKGDWHTIGVYLSLGVALIAARQSFFLGIWFLLSFLPFLKVYTEPVHLAYAMVPASVAVAAAVEKLWRLTAFEAWPVKIARYGTAAILALAIGDHALTLYGSYRVITSCNDGIVRVADWFKENTRPGSLVIGNAWHIHDIRFYSGGHIVPYWTLGAPSDPHAIVTPRKLEALLAANLDHHDVYLLDIDYDFSIDKAAYHSHRFVQNNGVAKDDLGPIHATSVHYPYLDPLRALVPPTFVQFLGAPDLENDFYHGPARDRRFQQREVYVNYQAYKVTSKRVRDYWYPDGAPKWVRDGFHGYRILEFNSRYFAVRQSEGEFDLRKVLRGRSPGSFVSDSLPDVLRRIVRATQPQGGSATIQTAGASDVIK